MTDSSDPARPSSRPSREPPTIDVTPTVVDEGARPESAAADEAQAATAAERADAANDALLEGGPADDPAAPDAASSDAMRAPEPSRRGPGFGALAGAGLLGGLVGAGAMLAFQAWRPAALPNDPRMAQLEQQIAALPRADTAGLERRLSALEGAQNGLAQRVQTAQTLAERGASRAEEALNRPQPGPAPSPPQNNPAVADLGNRLAALETQLREQGQTAARERQALRQSVEAAAAGTQGLERRIGEQEQRVAGLARAAEGGGEAARAGARLVLANRLDAALRDGAPYAEVLAGLRNAGVDAARLQPLEPFAQGGAPTAAALAQSFKPLSPRIVEAAKPTASAPASDPAASGESWTDRLLGLAQQVVTVRPVDAPATPEAQSPGQATGASPGAVEQALARGDLAAAVTAWDALPEPSRQASAEWGQQLKQLAAAEAASRALAADAVAALNQSTR